MMKNTTALGVSFAASVLLIAACTTVSEAGPVPEKSSPPQEQKEEAGSSLDGASLVQDASRAQGDGGLNPDARTDSAPVGLNPAVDHLVTIGTVSDPTKSVSILFTSLKKAPLIKKQSILVGSFYRYTAMCPAQIDAVRVPYAVIEVRNPTTLTALVSATLKLTVGRGARMAVYTTPPAPTDSGVAACDGLHNWSCNSFDACLTFANQEAIPIRPQSSVFILVESEDEPYSGTATFKLDTEALQ
jgi:hypothetical protein